jgi:predicted nucleic acid-binding protein
LDTNVMVVGLYSALGASYQLIRALDQRRLVMVLSSALLFEYDDLLRRKQSMLELTDHEVDTLLDQFCAMAECRRIHFLWRPRLPDAKDDMLVELAVAAGGVPIVTHNERDFRGLDDLGIEVITPGRLLKRLKITS